MFSSDINNALFANGGNKGAAANFDKLKFHVAGMSHKYQNDDQPLAEAQRISDQLMAVKQRRPMTFEWEIEKGKWATTTLYINPQRLSMQTQKLKSKAITRGGIFYHHWGDDHWTMSLSGTTGLAGMKGILRLEEAYKASGMLLRYQKYTVEEDGLNLEVGAYKNIDYKDAVSVLEAATSTTNPTMLATIQSQYNESNGSFQKVTNNLLKIINTNVQAQVKSNNLATINKQLDAYYDKAVKTRTPTSSEYYNNALSIARRVLGTSAPSDIVVALAYQKTINKYNNQGEELLSLLYKSSNQANSQSAIDKTINSTIEKAVEANLSHTQKTNIYLEDLEARATFINEARADALRSHLSEVADWRQREMELKSQLKGTIESTTDLFGDEWTPRRVVLYYENRAYIGHFDAFSYQRSADTPLIQYELRFTVEKMIVGTML